MATKNLRGKSLAGIFFVSLMICVLGSFVKADEIELKDGRVLKGQIIDRPTGEIYFESSGEIINFSVSDVAKINGQVLVPSLDDQLSRSVTRKTFTYEDRAIRLDVYHPGVASAPVIILIHGANGIEEAERRERYKKFGTDLMKDGVIAVVIYYFDAPSDQWPAVIREAITYSLSIAGADPNRIGLIGYSLGGTLALQVASEDQRVKALGINAGYLPSGFTAKNAKNLPPIFFQAGAKDSATNTLNALKDWAAQYGNKFEYQIGEGGHMVTLDVFWKSWDAIRSFMVRVLKVQ